MAFNQQHLEQLINIAGTALEREDRYISGCIASNPQLYANEKKAGILRCCNERYYQFIVARELMSSFPFNVNIEKGDEQFDIVFIDPVTSSPSKPFEAVGEMKLWMSSTGETEITPINTDIKKLKACPYTGIMIIFTANNLNDTENQLQWLSTKLNVNYDEFVFKKFQTHFSTASGALSEFAVVGFFV